MKQIEFIEKIAPDAMKIQMETGIPWQVVVAQTCLETGYGKSEPTDKTTGVESKNLHGIKYFGDMSQKNKYVIAWTLEHVSENDLPWWQKNHPELQKTGKIINGLIEIRIKEPFAVFDSYEQSFEKYKKVLTNKYFKHALRNKDDLEKYINDIQSKLPGEEHPKYATDEEYVDKILNIIRRYGLSD